MVRRVTASGWIRLLCTAVVLAAGIVASAYALSGKVAANTARIEGHDKDIRELRKEVHDIWKVYYNDTGRRRR